MARGYSEALKKAGHEVSDYRLYNRLKYHAQALRQQNSKLAEDVEVVTRLASETMVAEALRHRAELVVVISGMALHPDGLNLLNRAGFPIAAVYTEAPYDDRHQKRFSRYVGHPFANERISARTRGWGYLPAAYDPAIHKPSAPLKGQECDVLIIGTGWPERQKLLEGVDWTGIKLRVFGLWEGIEPGSPLAPFYRPGSWDNKLTPSLYASAKVCVNQHRYHPLAESLNPRAYELAACGALQVSDWRLEIDEVFGDALPIYASPATLEFQLRRLLALPEAARQALAEEQRAKVVSGMHTFDDRAARLMAAITSGGRNGQDPRSGRAVLPAGIRRERGAALAERQLLS